MGSSPHTRGALVWRDFVRVLHGIIPAYAGSTQTLLDAVIRVRDHPRIRGEHGLMLFTLSIVAGSSPHTRGAPISGSKTSTTVGIIPAYAGSTQLNKLKRERHRGSSPHTRGAPRGHLRGVMQAGIIPAYAGSTSQTRVWQRRYWDHPRIRGEHATAIVARG